MNNLIPSDVRMHEKYDLKGSTYKRRANPEERQKESPTWKDLDFMERHPEGLLLDAETYTALAKTVQRDCRVSAGLWTVVITSRSFRCSKAFRLWTTRF